MLLWSSKSPYIVKLLDIIWPKSLKTFNRLCLVLECSNSDLKKLCKSKIYLEEIHVKTILYNILLGLKYLHSANIIHRDIKTANVLINQNCSAKLCDFGLARCVTGVKTGVELLFEQAGEGVAEYRKHENPMTWKSRKDIYTNLIKTKDTRRLMQWEMTSHVITWWYRPPEIILLEKGYGFEVDIWSTGCVLAELLQMMKTNVETPSFWSPLF